MNKLVVLMGILVGSVSVISCTSGSSGSTPAPIYLESGDYMMALSNVTDSCGGSDESGTLVISDGNGQICIPDTEEPNNPPICFDMNLANNPCLYYSETDSESMSASMAWNNCSLNNTGMTADLLGILRLGESEIICSAQVTITNAN